VLVLAFAACSSPSGGDDGSNTGGGITPPSSGDQVAHTASGVSFYMRYVPAGTFKIDRGGNYPTGVLIDMTITKGYWMGETEVTQELWAAVMAGSANKPAPSVFSGSPAADEIQGKRPVDTINWYDAVEFCNILSLETEKDPVYVISNITRSSGSTGYITSATVSADFDKNGYRLPTEMEWMWAAMGANRGGETVTTTGYNKGYAGSAEAGSARANIAQYAWWHGNSDNIPHQTGIKTANELGIHDMSGNVWEWCWDLASAYPSDGKTNYTGPISESTRVVRGGSWDKGAADCALAFRNYFFPSIGDQHLGFRIVTP
jgi:formylglycine-generating enzyme required for sulfatase activity